MKNLQDIYYVYISGTIDMFLEDFDEAVRIAAQEDNGVEFGGQWLQAKVGHIPVGGVELHNGHAMRLDRNGQWDCVADVRQIPWVEWGNPATARV